MKAMRYTFSFFCVGLAALSMQGASEGLAESFYSMGFSSAMAIAIATLTPLRRS